MTPTFVSRRYGSAKEFIDTCGSILVKTRPTSANLPLSSSFSVAQGQTPAREDIEEWWISIAPQTQSDGTEILFAFIAMGTWPGALACSIDPKELGTEYIKDAMQALVGAVRAANVSSTRLTSVTAPTSIGYPFADAWAAAHGLTRLAKPIVHMTHAVATRERLRPPVRPKLDDVDFGKVNDDELDAAAQLIVDFTRDFPHKYDLEGARKYVKKFIDAGEIYRATVEGTLKAFVVITRRTPGVKAVAHVYTAPDTRGKGLAEALLRYAIESTLSDPEIDRLCLFVEPSNAVAARVYGRVGFVGLETGVPDDRTEEWAEVGFEGVTPLEF